MELEHCLLSVEKVAEYAAAYIQIEDFGGTHNWTLSIKQASAQHGS
jgi:hypothetical protein